MMSVLQQRQLIEAAFVPYVCNCTLTPDGMVSIRVSDPKTEAVVLTLDGISSSNLTTWSAISSFVERLQRDLERIETTAASGYGCTQNHARETY